MLGMLGIIVQNNEIRNTTQILQVVAPGERYLVKFLNPPVFSRVCSVEEIQQWLLFATQDEANAWVEQSQRPAPGGAQPPGKPPTQGQTSKPNGSGSDSQDEEIVDEDPPIVPAKPVPTPTTEPAKDASRFQRPDAAGENDKEDNKK